MENILYINACVRKESRTNRLGKHLLAKLKGEVNIANLEEKSLCPLNETLLDERNALINNRKFNDKSFNEARQFADANIIVISAPYWDLSFPAILKIYLERINVLGIIFEYTSDGRIQSLCKAKKLIYVTTAGGKIPEPNTGYLCVKQFAEFFCGISNFEYYKAEGLDVVGADIEKELEQAENEINKVYIVH